MRRLGEEEGKGGRSDMSKVSEQKAGKSWVSKDTGRQMSTLCRPLERRQRGKKKTKIHAENNSLSWYSCAIMA